MYLKVHYAKVAFVANNVAGDENVRNGGRKATHLRRYEAVLLLHSSFISPALFAEIVPFPNFVEVAELEIEFLFREYVAACEVVQGVGHIMCSYTLSWGSGCHWYPVSVFRWSSMRNLIAK